MLLRLTQSESTSVRCVIPERTRPSAHQLPTPPTPKRMTRTCPMADITSSPTRSFVRLKAGSLTGEYMVSVLFGQTKIVILGKNPYLAKNSKTAAV
jgi:hypothetical protein